MSWRAQDYAQRMKDDGVTRAIIVVQQHLTPFARQSLLETERSKYHIEQFHEQELLVNITQHVLVPEHQLLSGAPVPRLCCVDMERG